MPKEAVRVLLSREQSTMVSTWDEKLGLVHYLGCIPCAISCTTTLSHIKHCQKAKSRCPMPTWRWASPPGAFTVEFDAPWNQKRPLGPSTAIKKANYALLRTLPNGLAPLGRCGQGADAGEH